MSNNATSDPPTRSPWYPRAARAGRLVVGAIFLFAGVAKALHPSGFATQIDSYGWIPTEWTYAAAVGFIAVELVLGSALIFDVLPRASAAGVAALLGLFIVVLFDAWFNERQVDCGCFGNLAQRGPGQALGEDIGMLVLLVPTFLWRGVPHRAHWRMATVAAISVLGLGLTVAAPSLPLDGLLTALVPEADLEQLGMDALVPEQGAVLVALLDIQDETSWQSVEALNGLAVEVLEVEIMALAAAGPEDRAAFGWEAGSGFPVEEIGASTMNSLARRLPRFALLVDGRVTTVWDVQPPGPEELRSALEGGT